MTVSIFRMSWYFERDFVQCSDACLLLSEIYSGWKIRNLYLSISLLNPLPKKRFLLFLVMETHTLNQTAQERSFVRGVHNSKAESQCKMLIYRHVSLKENSSLSFFETQKNSVTDISKCRNADLSYHPGVSLRWNQFPVMVYT